MDPFILTNHLKMHAQYLMDLRAGKIELTQSALDDQIQIINASIQYAHNTEKQNQQCQPLIEEAIKKTREGATVQ